MTSWWAVFGYHREKSRPYGREKIFKNRIFMIKISIIFVNTPSSMLFMMYQHKSCKNKPLSYTTTPQTAHKQYFWLYKKCKNSDFGVVLCYQEEDVPRNKCLLLLRVLLLVGKHSIDHWNLLFHML